MQKAGYINGEFVTGRGADLRVENPSDGGEVACFPGVSVEQIETTITAARQAFNKGDWSQRPMRERAEILHRFIDAMEERAVAIKDVLVAETGCPMYSSSLSAQFETPMRMAREIIDLMASLPEMEENPLPPTETQNRLGQKVRSLRSYAPLGVVVGISAYNFPLHTGVWKIMPALIAGNSVILRPNPLTPLSSMVAFAAAAATVGLPPGVLNVVLEAGVEGARLLTTHPLVDMITFTGSTPVGAQVATQAAATFKRVHLELGGKSAQIFLPDAIEKAAAAAVTVCTSHAGQGCVLGTRIFVPQANKAEIVAQVAAAVSVLKLGYSTDPTTQVGPVISANQVARCEHFVQLALEHGGRVAAGGKRPAHLDGFFFEPTVLDLPDNTNPAAQEEIFGPVVGIIGYRDIDHAIEMANDSKYGLSGYVYGKNVDEAFAVAQRVESGAVHVNGALSSTFVPFGGIKSSGLGHERGVEGMRMFQRLKIFSVTENGRRK